MAKRKGLKMQLTVHVTSVAAGAVEQFAAKEDVSLSEVVERALRSYFKIKDKN